MELGDRLDGALPNPRVSLAKTNKKAQHTCLAKVSKGDQPGRATMKKLLFKGILFGTLTLAAIKLPVSAQTVDAAKLNQLNFW